MNNDLFPPLFHYFKLAQDALFLDDMDTGIRGGIHPSFIELSGKFKVQQFVIKMTQ